MHLVVHKVSQNKINPNDISILLSSKTLLFRSIATACYTQSKHAYKESYLT